MFITNITNLDGALPFHLLSFSLSTPFTPRGVANVLPFGLLIYLFRLRDLLVLCDHCIAQCYLNRTASV